jgi:Flp pilus assembly protein TadD
MGASPSTGGSPKESDTVHNGPEAPRLEVAPEEAIRTAIDLLDRVERGDVQGTWETVSKEIDGYIAVVQAEIPNSPWLAYLYGRVYAIGGRRGDAIEQLQRFVETREGRNEWGAFRLLGDLFVEEFPRLARANYDKAAALKAGEPSVLYGLSRCAARMGDFSEAVTLARQAVEGDHGRTIRYMAHLARMLLKNRQYDEAERSALDAARLASEEGQDHSATDRWLRIENAQYELLMEILQERLRESPTADGYVRMAEYMGKRSALQSRISGFEIVQMLEAGISRAGSQTTIQLLATYAVALTQTGQTARAMEAFREVQQKDPSNPVAAEWLPRLQDAASPPQSTTAP